MSLEGKELQAAHIIPQARPDVYGSVLGDDFDGEPFKTSHGLLLSKGWHGKYDAYLWSSYYKDGVYYVHFWEEAAMGRLNEEQQYHGKAIMPDRFSSDVLLVLIAIILPPAAVGILTGCSCALLICFLLSLLGYIPGHLYAFYIIYRKIQADERYGPSGYVYVSQGVYQPIGVPGSFDVEDGRHQQGQAQQEQGQGELYAGQARRPPGDPPKGPPPAYGAV
ncbi:MAG: hypothetical protein CYPHOPRED_005562 [Cyphobasidiales sp. Tagirdzhanova-0007]|nr:MAG: hypothetical protein CYPHOPRED_005562 [Cyphobasidiales sp. Tagirdzhanova-0007]